jgi:hypothetical protein
MGDPIGTGRAVAAGSDVSAGFGSRASRLAFAAVGCSAGRTIGAASTAATASGCDPSFRFCIGL